ncbi:hypothetical protein [Pseudomonas sp. HY7a-MNA-CIBAN-0227]|uniref:hypothetical protein n=1 Tax=Pseudomonas sp. HY7a-MNA-CIBAN-0227 TaxID=3140474 RepID=UPI0033333FBE
MENILLKYKQNTSYAKCFEILETELAASLETARPEEMILILKKEVFDRLSQVNPALKTKSNVYTYAESVIEIVQPEHRIFNLFTKNVIDAIEKEWNHGDNAGPYEADEFYITAISMHTVKAFLEVENAEKGADLSHCKYANYDMSFLVKFERFIFDTDNNLEKHIAKHSLYKVRNEIEREYFKITAELDESQNEFYETGLDKKSSTAAISDNHTKYEFETKLNKSVGECIELISTTRWNHFKEDITWKFNVSYMYSVILNIANLSDREWTKFMSGYYTDIPHIKRKTLPTVAIIAYTDSNERFFEAQPCEVLIKGKSELIHIIIDERSQEVSKFDKYNLIDGETITFAGVEIEINADCLEGNHLTLFEMINFGNDNVVISKDFRFDTRTFRALALGYQKGNSIETHMHDRAGLHNRMK